MSKKTKKIELSSKERDVLKNLAEYEGYRTTREIADASSVSWEVAYNFLIRLLENNWINHFKKGKWDYWKAVLG